MKGLLVAGLVLMSAAVVTAGAGAQDPSPSDPRATGVVFHDRNRDGQRGPGEEGLAGVRVSNGREVVRTDARGRWQLPSDEDTIFFVVKPRGWMTPVDGRRLPRFYYIHKPAGSPPLKYAGVPPTGPLPASIDFPLHRQREPDRFRVIFFADTQPRDQKEIEYIGHDVVEELVGADASFGVTLGDVLFDDLSLYDSLNGTVALIGLPWYNVLGNHDINLDAPTDQQSDETFERTYGPSYYSFDHGPTHFIVLDDVEWLGAPRELPPALGGNRYRGGLGPEQIAWVKNELQLVPRNQLVVLMMHIPLVNVEDRQELYRLIEERPHTMSISGHTHYQEHRFITREDGWRGPEPHHHVINVTVSGSWWSGIPDERGIPHTTMRDGAPNGYSIATFDGHRYSFEFKAASRPKDYQMNIYAPESIEARQAGMTEVLVNVFGGSERSKVEMRLGAEDTWVTMQKAAVHDPAYSRLKQMEATPSLYPPAGVGILGRKLPAIIVSPHIWRGVLPRNPHPGVRPIEVRTTDMFGQSYTAQRTITIR